MAGFNQAQTGNRVYGAGGRAPNMGQVSAKGAQGYLAREQRKSRNGAVTRPIGSDGKSDSRSGVAANALKRQMKTTSAPVGNAQRQPQQQQMPQVAPNDDYMMQATGGNTPPPIQVNATGQLALPYDQNLSAEDLAAYTDANSEMSSLALEEQQQAAQYSQSLRDAAQQNRLNQRATLSGNASGGTLHSSQYGMGVANDAQEYGRVTTEINSTNSAVANDIASRRGAIQSALAAQLAQNAQDRQDRLNAEIADGKDIGHSDDVPNTFKNGKGKDKGRGDPHKNGKPGKPRKDHYPKNRKGRGRGRHFKGEKL